MEEFQKELDNRADENKDAQDKQAQIQAVTGSGQQIVAALGSIHDALLASPIAKDKKIAQVAIKLAGFIDQLDKSTEAVKNTNLQPLASSLQSLGIILTSLPSQIEAAHQKIDPTTHLKAINSTLKAKEFSPKINNKVDVTPITKALENINKNNPVDLSKLEELTTQVASSVNAVKRAIEKQVFPVPNYVLPFKDVNGRATQVQLDASGNVPTTGGGSGGGGTQYLELNTTSPATGTVALGRYQLSPPTLTNGQLYAPQLDASGNLKVAGSFSSTPPADIAPATQNITVIDSASSSATGANNQTIVIGTPTVGSAASFALSTIETVRVEVTGIWTGTLTAEISIDGGTTWTSQGLHQGAYTTSSFTAGFIGGANVTGATNFRMRATATITGTAVVKIIESVNTQSVYVANAAPAGNVASVLNSTSSALTSGSTYTGTGEDVANFSEMRISVFSNVVSATDGFSIQQSSDNANWDVVDTYTIAAATAGQGKTFVVPRQARYFRVVYTNGGTNQATFRLQSILNRTATAPSSQRATDAYTNETDLVQNQTFLMGYNGTTWDRIRTVGTGVLSASAVLTAGSAIIGKVGIDQTTPGTTNLVSLSAETTKVIGTVNQGTSPWVVSGTVTANAGTNLNTSALALETGGNLAAIKADVDNLGLAQASATSGQKGNLILGAVTTSAPTYTTAQSNPLSMDTAGNLRVALGASSSVIGHVITDSGSVTAATLSAETTKVIGTVNIAASQTIAVTQATGTNLHTVVDSGTITTLTGTTTLTPGTAATNLGKAEDSAAADGDTGVFSLNRRNDNAATAQTGTNGDYSAAAVDINGSMFNRPAPANTSALTTVVSSATTVTLLAANAARRLMTCYNSSTSDAYVKFGTTASSTSFSLYLPSLGSFSLNGEDYAGRIDIIWISANGNAFVTETSI